MEGLFGKFTERGIPKRATSEWDTKSRTDNGSDKSGGGDRIEEDEEQQGNGAGRDSSEGVESWRVLGGKGVNLLWDLMFKIEEQEYIPDE